MNTKNDAGIRDAGCGVRTGEFERIYGSRIPDPGCDEDHRGLQSLSISQLLVRRVSRG
jgi:hypothetical protein